MTSADRALLNAVLRTDFSAFFQRCFLTLNPGATYMPNWHIQALAYHLDLVRVGKLRRLIINMPPRSLKSLMCSVAFPAFVLGHDPTKRFIVVSYNANLAHKLGSHFRTILQSSWYQDIFYDTRISRLKNTQAEVVTTRHGSRFATSVGGTLTGRGGDFVIVDDPLKPKEAYSDKRESVNDWFDNTAYSRLDNKLTGVIIVAMQRLHVNDLSGKLLRSSDEWTRRFKSEVQQCSIDGMAE